KCSRRQLELQPSPERVLPSSHCSVPSRVPSPQTGSSWQVEEQASPEMLLPSSHSSTGLPPGSSVPLPQYSQRQVEEQPSPFTVPPSSHCSKPSRTPLPHT